MIRYGYGWLFDLLWRAAGLELDEEQLERVATVARRKLVDLFEVAKETALANGREEIRRHDLPLTRGLRRTVEETAELSRASDVDPALVFAGEARVNRGIDELVRADLPRLTIALLVLQSHIVAALEPVDMPLEERRRRVTRSDPYRPTGWEWERTARVLDLTL
jgi:hypothetical protein